VNIEVAMRFKKSTPGTHVFEEIDGDGALMESQNAHIPVLYIRKAAMTELAQRIKVTVEVIK